mgnify:CR=1 FL=1
MVTMLDCIQRSEDVGYRILRNSRKSTDPLKDIIPDFKVLKKIYMIGSGSSFNASGAVSSFMEKVSGLEVSAFLPNVFSKKNVFHENAL